jgi:hypothetical protein
MTRPEPVRISGVILFEKNLLDPVIWASTSIIYVFCHITFASDASFVTFLFIVSLFCGLFNYHLESYRSFRRIRRHIHLLESDDKPGLKAFLSSHLRYLKPNHVFEHPADTTEMAFAVPFEKVPDDRKAPAKHDTYRWANKVISFFWPYLSHVVHHELNEFLAKSQILAENNVGLKRVLFAFIKQIDANILAIERCELGSNAPYIKSIHVSDKIDDQKGGKRLLVYDLDLIYEGNMDIAFICRYFCCCNSRLGLKDVFVHLSSRLTVGPIDDLQPSIEGISISLLKLPKFGYKGIALVELARLRLARRSINRLIKTYLLYPKSISMTFKDLLETINCRNQQEARNDTVHDARRVELAVHNDNQPEPLSWSTRCIARLMFCACMCSNFCLRICQEEKLNQSSQQLEMSGRIG